MAQPIISCVCRGCSIRFVYEVNCVVVTMGDTLKGYGAKGAALAGLAGVRATPDLVSLIGDEGWPEDREPTAPEKLPEEVASAYKARSARRWTCHRCQTEQDYDWDASDRWIATFPALRKRGGCAAAIAILVAMPIVLRTLFT